jgi:hypothetical protein
MLKVDLDRVYVILVVVVLAVPMTMAATTESSHGNWIEQSQSIGWSQ